MNTLVLNAPKACKPHALALATSVLAVALAWGSSAWAQAKAEPALNYTVQANDKIISLASELLIEPAAWPQVVAFNRLPNANRIQPGQVIAFPLRLLKREAASARLISAHGDVSLPVGATLTEGSKLTVGANSTAVLQLADGSTVKVLPRSLAEVLENRNYKMREPGSSISSNWFSGLMRVVQGGVEVVAEKSQRRAEPLRVETATAVIGVRGTVFRVSHDGTLARTEVIEGRVQADNTKQASQADVAGGFGAMVDPAVREIAVKKLLPPPQHASADGVIELRRPNVVLGLQGVSGAARYRMQAATDAKFNALVLESVGVTPSADLTALADGDYFLRARSIDALGIEGTDGVRRVRIAPPVALPYVVTGEAAFARLTASQSQAFGGLALRVELPAKALLGLPSRMELSRSVSMTGAQQHSLSTNGELASAELGALQTGTWYVRFVGQAGSQTRTSPVYRMEVDASLGVSVREVLGALQPTN